MEHNNTARKFRDELIKRKIKITMYPWDHVIHKFSKNNSHLDNTSLVRAINATINGVIWNKSVMKKERLLDIHCVYKRKIVIFTTMALVPVSANLKHTVVNAIARKCKKLDAQYPVLDGSLIN